MALRTTAEPAAAAGPRGVAEAKPAELLEARPAAAAARPAAAAARLAAAAARLAAAAARAGAAGSSGGAAGAAGGGGAAGANCAPLLKAVQDTLAEAVACNPAISSIQCDGSATSPDTCDCPVLLNEKTPDKVKAAQDAYKAWTTAGCGPFQCGKACFAGTTGACDATTSTCQWK
ncbi:MAG: hypothetical protein H6717_05935 [Polyangiaceae bacterium]|nr:hypothetical protein [Polyangiaceae bacterium]